MKKLFDLQINNWLIHIFAIGILLTGAWVKFFTLGNAFYSDTFHHGEFVSSPPSLLAGNINFFTLHGAMDWLPAWFSQQVFGAERHFLPTMLIHASLSALAGLFLYCVIALLTGRNSKYRATILIVSAVLAVYLVDTRDIFLILAILLYFLCEESSSQRGRNVLEIALGMLLAINLLWSFDRGITGIAGIGFACLILVVAERRYLLSIIVFVISLWILHWIGALSFSRYIDNFQFLLATSSQWSYGYTIFEPVLFTILVAIPNGWAIYYLGKQLHQAIRTSWKETAHLSLLIILSILMFKIATNRADTWHVVMALWMPALAFLYVCRNNAVKLSIFAYATTTIAIVWLAFTGLGYWVLSGSIIPIIFAIETKYPKFTRYLASPILAIVAIAIPVLLAGILKISSLYSQGGYQWMSQVSSPPTNQSLANASTLWVSAEILKVGSNCVFDLSNNGVINGVTGLPACTKYTYPVYATQRYEKDMLQQLQRRNPPAVVFFSAYWSFSIDGKSMHDRFPELTDYLVKAYPYEKCNWGYCLRFVNQPG